MSKKYFVLIIVVFLSISLSFLIFDEQLIAKDKDSSNYAGFTTGGSPKDIQIFSNPGNQTDFSQNELEKIPLSDYFNSIREQIKNYTTNSNVTRDTFELEVPKP